MSEKQFTDKITYKASEEEKSTEINIMLEGVKIRDIMSKEVQTVPKGIVTFTDVQKIAREERKTVKVSQVMSKKIIGRIIVKKGETISGIVSRTDIIRAIQLLEKR